MKIELYNYEYDGKEFDYPAIKSPRDMEVMSEDELRERIKSIREERKQYGDTDQGLVLDEVARLLEVEIACREEHPPFTLSWSEKRTVIAVFSELLKMKYDDLNRIVGSLTIKEMQELNHRLEYDDYCHSHHIRYEDMDGEDYINAYLEEHDYYDYY